MYSPDQYSTTTHPSFRYSLTYLPSQAPIDPDRDKLHILRDGRQICYSLYGSTRSSPSHHIIYLHGLPGSRVEASEWSSAASHHDAQLVALDRPGFGLSSLHPGRTLSMYPEDVLELVNGLGIETFYVAGVSGGGPYALSCARRIPKSRLKGVAVIAGLSEFEHYRWKNNKSTTSKSLFQRYALRYFPNFIAQQSDARFGKLARSTVSPEPMRDFWRAGLKSYTGENSHILQSQSYIHLMSDLFREVFRQGWKGYAEDGKILNRSWDFKLEEIDHENVLFAYGEMDVDTPPEMGRNMHEKVENSRLFIYPDATHLSLAHVSGREVIGELIGKS